jgi:cytochrome c peroxidase
MRNRTSSVLAVALAGLCLAASAVAHAGPDPYLRPNHAPAPANNPVTAARVELGKALFFDPRLSGSNWISCATCHNPSLGWSDGLPTGYGHGMLRLKRATPTIVNAAFNKLQMWDGRRTSLEDQALGPVESDAEMRQDIPDLVKKLAAIPGYVSMFERAYPGEGITGATLAKAIASFERTVLSSESPFDRWRRGEAGAVDARAKRGFELFTGKANCAKCHQGFNFTDDGFHNIGLRSVDGTEDLGRFTERKVALMRGAFKTPTLRDIALTAPYMHNGIYATLEEVIDHYDRGGDVKDNLSPEIKPLDLTASEKSDMVAFLRSLTGKPVPVAVPRLPH